MSVAAVMLKDVARGVVNILVTAIALPLTPLWVPAFLWYESAKRRSVGAEKEWEGPFW